MSETLTINPETAEAASAREDWSEAARLWRALVETEAHPGPHARAKLLEALARLGQWSEVEPIVVESLEAAPDNPILLRFAARSAEHERNWSEASQRWTRFFTATGKPPAKPVLREAIRTACLAGDLEEAERILALTPSKPMTPAERRDLESEIGGHALRWKAGFPIASVTAPQTASLSVQEICRAFWEIESRLGLLEWTVGGVALWPLLRLNAYYRLTQQVGLYDPPHPALKAKLGHATEQNLLLDQALAGRDALLISATKKMNGSEPYSDAVRHALGGRVVVMDRPVDGELLSGAVNFDKVIAGFRIDHARADDRYLSAEDRFRIYEIQNAFRHEVGAAPPELIRSARHNLAQFRCAYRGFAALFASHRFERVFITNAYGLTLRAVVAAARDAGVRSIELQHGFISQYHLGYSWPGRPEVPHAPDELWTFGSFWSETTPLPGQTSTRVIGAPYVADKARGAPRRDPRLVVFTSQGVIGRRLFSMAIETARRRPDKRVVFRLHPNESNADFQALAPADAPDNFSLSAGVPNIFALLAEAEIQVGAFSTTLLEGMSLGTRTIVLDLPGIEYMTPVIRRGDALFVRTTEDLIEKLDSAPLAKDPEAYYAAPQSLEDLRRTD